MQSHKFPTLLIVALMIILLSLTLASTAWAAEYKAIYKFRSEWDGDFVYAGLIRDAAGNLYGATHGGGSYGLGTVFKLTKGTWEKNTLYSFAGGTDGAGPDGALVFDDKGNLFGTTCCHGVNNHGTVFKLSLNPDGTWTESIIHSFNNTDGSDPEAGLIVDAAGNLYGTTYQGGDFGCGVVFKVTPSPDGSWTQEVLHTFGSTAGDGLWSSASVTFDTTGNLYGTTRGGGTFGHGTVFTLLPNPDGSWTEKVIWSFRRGAASPYGGVIFDKVGQLYGTTETGGSYGGGTVFKLTPNPDGSWRHSRLHAFRGEDGALPHAGLIFDSDGNLYGTTTYGGPYLGGSVFKLTPQPDGHWKLTRLHAFTDRFLPWAGVVMDAAGRLYGTTLFGGNGYGVVFKITP